MVSALRYSSPDETPSISKSIRDANAVIQMISQIDEVSKKFYKYRSMSGDSLNWVEKTVLQNEIFFASASSFNDPFDLRPSFTLEASDSRRREDYLRLSRKFEPHLNERQRKHDVDLVMSSSLSATNLADTTATIQALHNFQISNAIGVLCVSAKRDDILMWSHYSDSHRGVCLEFDGRGTLMEHAQKVQYSHIRVPINPYDDDNEKAMSKALLTKSAQWSYEDEWRLIRYQQGPGVASFNPRNLTGIIIGALASNSTIEIIRSWIRQRSLPLDVYRASVSGSKFELKIDSFKRL